MTSQKPIPVTGSYRCGITWVGKMIATSPSVGYIHEPFNPLLRPGIFTAKIPNWFMYVTEENETPFYKPLKNTLAFRFSVSAELPELRSPRLVGRMAKNWYNFYRNRSHHAIPLMKDPIALFSSEWLAQRFEMRVIMLIRHPAAFASSLRRLNWGHDFSGFLQQPLLMRDHLAPFANEIEAFAKNKQDILDQAILLWRMMHHVMLKYQAAHSDWLYLRHEDISADPLQHFTHIFKHLKLDFTEQIKTTIEDYTNSSNPSDAQKGHILTKRDSKSNIKSWKKKLSEAEITHIRTKVEDISHWFYSDSDW
jgi:Sulfotransferase family